MVTGPRCYLLWYSPAQLTGCHRHPPFCWHGHGRHTHLPCWAQLQVHIAKPSNPTSGGRGSTCVRAEACPDSLPDGGAAPHPARDIVARSSSRGTLSWCPSHCGRLFGGGSDLAERREVQSRQRAVEHVPHCSQQLEAGKHLVKKVREWLLWVEKQQLGAGGHITAQQAGSSSTAAFAPCVRIPEGLVQGCIMLLATQSPFPTWLPHNYSPAPGRAAGLQACRSRTSNSPPGRGPGCSRS